MRYKIKKSFYVGMSCYQVGQEYELSDNIANAVKDSIELTITPPQDVSKIEVKPEAKAENKNLESPVKDKMIKKSKNKKEKRK